MHADTWTGRLPKHAETLAAAFRDSGGWTHATTVQRFQDAAAAFPTRDAVVGADGVLTYAELDRRSDQVAAVLHRHGLKPGDPVIMQVANSAEAVLAFYSLLKAGAVPVATLAAHREHEIHHIAPQVGATAHLIDASVNNGFLVGFADGCQEAVPGLRHRLCVGADADGFLRIKSAGLDEDPAEARSLVDSIQANLDPESVAVFQLSGGTTGTPKVIPRLHAEYWNNALTNSTALGRTEASRIAHAMPIIHNAGVVHALFGAHSVGGCVVVVQFGPTEDCVDFLIQAGVTDMMIAGPMAPWVDHPAWEKVSESLTTLIFSGSKLPVHIYERAVSLGTWVGQVWGMAEGPYMTTSLGAEEAIRRDTVGWPNTLLDDFKIVDDNGDEVPDGDPGRLLYRGPTTLAGYFDAPKHNQIAIDPDGYLDTGDLACIVDINGQRCVRFEGRLKDVISRGGEKISTEEVEQLLLRHPAIAEAAVVAMPDELFGERACAYISLNDPNRVMDISEVQRHFGQLGVAKFKWPERLEVVTSLPRTNTLKIDKKRLRQEVAGQI
jgi:2,3-dihydroxybenzoate-AMP ligase